MKARAVMLVGLGLLLAACSSTPTTTGATPTTTGATPTTTPTTTASSTRPATGATTILVRPVQCAAAAYSPQTGQPPPGGPLPTCASGSQLSGANLLVVPSSSSAVGYTMNSTIPADQQFAAYPSTTPAADTAGSRVLLDAAPASGASGRYVLGPAGLSGSSVQSASAYFDHAVWTVNVTLTPAGSAAWDVLARTQFHAYTAVDVNGQIVALTIIEPTAMYFTTFDGQLQIPSSDRAAAQALAREISSAR